MKKILYILVLAVFTVVLANAQQQQQRVTLVGEPTNSGFVPKVQGAEIEFEKLVHDFGEIIQNANGDVDFKFRNVGSDPLVILSVQQSCATCVTIRSWPREPIMPGQEGVIAVRYNTHILGDMGKTVTVSSNARSNRVVLRLNGTVINRR